MKPKPNTLLIDILFPKHDAHIEATVERFSVFLRLPPEDLGFLWTAGEIRRAVGVWRACVLALDKH